LGGGGGGALSMALRACRAPDHESEAKASSTVVARRGARIPRAGTQSFPHSPLHAGRRSTPSTRLQRLDSGVNRIELSSSLSSSCRVSCRVVEARAEGSSVPESVSRARNPRRSGGSVGALYIAYRL
jgi:hypothetical protein